MENAMLPKPKYCSQCGATAETQVRDGKPRDVCSVCDTIVYQNPPPLAAGVVLNERREVLLVKCKRLREGGAWCLPMDSPEPGESMVTAAQRALREKTGIETRFVRLLDTDSSENEEHRDVLIVTFEMRKVGGNEAPGPDAETAAYFPLSRHPELVLPCNEKALRICADSHQEEWMIRDSFERLRADESKVMLSDAMISFIKDHAEEVARVWLADVCENPSTTAYSKLDPDKLLEKAIVTLSRFSRWLGGTEADQEVTDHYVAIGRERKAQGFSAHEILSALMLLKKHLWIFARNHGVWERPIDVYRVLELNRRIAVFFDKAIYHAIRGFEAEEAK
jgi:ADP-ribose pyrophosphatase YjhB (NUDIX family)